MFGERFWMTRQSCHGCSPRSGSEAGRLSVPRSVKGLSGLVQRLRALMVCGQDNLRTDMSSRPVRRGIARVSVRELFSEPKDSSDGGVSGSCRYSSGSPVTGSVGCSSR